MKIIALKGIGGSGKTTTIKKLPDILKKNSYAPVPNSYQKHGADFIDIYTNGTDRVGITSRGDSYSIVYRDLNILVQQGCNICICACRTRGGTHKAIKQFPNYINIYINKIFDKSSTQNITNDADAMSIFLAI